MVTVFWGCGGGVLATVLLELDAEDVLPALEAALLLLTLDAEAAGGVLLVALELPPPPQPTRSTVGSNRKRAMTFRKI